MPYVKRLVGGEEKKRAAADNSCLEEGRQCCGGKCQRWQADAVTWLAGRHAARPPGVMTVAHKTRPTARRQSKVNI